MNDRSTGLLLGSTLIAGFAALIYSAIRHRDTMALLTEINNSAKDTATETHSLHFTLRQEPMRSPRFIVLPVPQGSPQATH